MKKNEKRERGIAVVTVRGVKKYCANVTLPNKKRKKAYFDRKEDARAWLENYRKMLGIDLSDFAALSTNRLADIRKALEILPSGHSLTEIVEDYRLHCPDIRISMVASFENYKEHLKSLNKGTLPRLHTYKFLETFKTWEDATTSNVLNWLKERGAPKTIKEYKSDLKKFFDFCKRRGFCGRSPLDKISSADLPKLVRANIPTWDIPDAQIFFEFLEEQYPKRVSWFAIACFAGIRRAEINRLKPKMFDLKNRRITLPYSIVKTADSWVMEALPDNLWAWLDKYGLNFPKMYNVFFDKLTKNFSKYHQEKTGNPFKWKHNICRHSFSKTQPPRR